MPAGYSHKRNAVFGGPLFPAPARPVSARTGPRVVQTRNLAVYGQHNSLYLIVPIASSSAPHCPPAGATTFPHLQLFFRVLFRPTLPPHRGNYFPALAMVFPMEKPLQVITSNLLLQYLTRVPSLLHYVQSKLLHEHCEHVHL